MVLGFEGLAFHSAVHTGLRLSIVSLTQILAPLCQGDKEVAVVLIAAGLLSVFGRAQSEFLFCSSAVTATPTRDADWI